MFVPWLLGSGLLACSQKSTVPDAAATPGPSAVFAPLDQHLAKLLATDRWQGSLALTQEGELVYAAAVGRLGTDDARAIDTQTRFRIGSITKTFASVVVHQLVDEGKLALDAPLSTWFPEIPNAAAITIDHALQHRSGLASFTDDPEYVTWYQQATTREALVERIAAYTPAFEPDSAARYSNSNYVLLGFVIEDVDGRSFEESVMTRIVEPLELSETSVGGLVDPSNNEARSMTWMGEAWKLAPETHPSVPGAAGAVVSTPTDLCTFGHALFSGDLVSETSLANMRNVTDGYGRGLFASPIDGRDGMGHTGGIDGFTSQLTYFPDDGTCLAITSHASDYDSDVLAIGAMSLHAGRPWTPPEVVERVSLTADQIEPFVGTYQSEALPLVITVTREGNVLWAQAAGQPSFPLEPLGPSEFVFEEAALRMVFEVLDEVATFTLYQGGGEFPYVRDAG